MSREIMYDLRISSFLAELPYEPFLRKSVLCDLYVFRHVGFGSVYDCDKYLVEYFAGKIDECDLLEQGIFLYKCYEDRALLEDGERYLQAFYDKMECTEPIPHLVYRGEDHAK